MQRIVLKAAILLVLVGVLPIAAGVELSIDPTEATIGDALRVVLTIDAADERVPLRQKLGPKLGPFVVLEEGWTESTDEDSLRWTWSATVAAYETGALEFPSLEVLAVEGERWTTDPLTITVKTVLEEPVDGEDPPELADIKAPVGVAPDYSTLMLAGFVLGVLLVAAGIAWWLYRRYAAQLAAAPVVEDPFSRQPPHEWAFGALKALLDERGAWSTDRFYAKLSWILKRYLGGRYRADLLESTTDEVRPVLEQAGVSAAVLAKVGGVLSACDAVKFAKYEPADTERKATVDAVYEIIDQTKPAAEVAESA